MKATLVVLLCLCILHHAVLGATETTPRHDRDQSLVSLVVEQARQLQQQGDQLKQQDNQLKQQDDQLKQQDDQLKQQGDQLKQQGDQLKQLQRRMNRLLEQSDDVQRLQNQAKSLEDRLEWNTANLTVVRQQQATLGQQVAFQATLRKNDVTANTPIRFGLEFMMGAEGYNSHTGIYTVPIPGVYLFAFQVFDKGNVGFMPNLYINNVVRIRSRCQDKYDNSCAASSFFHLKKGDKVWMETTATAIYYGNFHSFFTGSLISPDP